MKKEILILLFLALLNSVSGQIILQEVPSVYNVGDSVDIGFSIEMLEKTSGYVECYLNCGERLLVYKKYQVMEENQKYYFNLSFPVFNKGKCDLEAAFAGEKETSEEFEVSNLIRIDYSMNNKFFFPSEKLIINGAAVKSNGKELKGSAKISLGILGNRTIEVYNGTFSSEIEIKKDALPGEYNLEVEAIEKDAEGNVINYGQNATKIVVKAKPTAISIQTKESVRPQINHSSNISLLDQAGKLIKNESVIVKLFDPYGDLVYEEKIGSSKEFIYLFEDNATRGAWSIKAYYGDVFSLKPVYIEDNKKLDFDVVTGDDGSYLKVTNTGNVEYNGTLSVILDNSSSKDEMLINVGLDLGRDKSYPMEYEGEYNISVDGKNFSNFNFPIKPSPTGAAIAPELEISMKNYIILFVLLLAVLLYFLFSRRKHSKGELSKKEKQEDKATFMIFFKFDKFFEEIKEIVEKENFSLSKVNDNLYYVLFYSSHVKDPEESAYRLAGKIRNKCLSRACAVSIVINSSEETGKEDLLKDFSLKTRKMVEHAEGGILVSGGIFEKLKVKAQKSLVFNNKSGSSRMYKIQ
jgi:hypothetical protein